MADELPPATAACPRCGAEYLARVATCADCGIPLKREGDDGDGEVPFSAEDEVAYALEDWAPEQRQALVASLTAEGVAARWEADELVVAEADVDLVEELIEEIDVPDALDAEEDGSDEAARTLSALYVTSDVLSHDPGSSAAVVELLQVAEGLADLGLPYGLDGEQWGTVVRRVDELADVLGAEADEAEVILAARNLRVTVRPLV